MTAEQFSIKMTTDRGHVDFDTIEFKPEELLSTQEGKALTAQKTIPRETHRGIGEGEATITNESKTNSEENGKARRLS